MRFVETQLFTKKITALLADDDYRELQVALTLRPELGSVIQRTGGARKVRWGDEHRGKGKRGGVRIIYYWDPGDSAFYMLFAFSKDEQSDLTRDQQKTLRQVIEEEFP